MDGAVSAFWAWGSGLSFVGNVGLGIGRKVDYCVGYGVGAAEGEDNSLGRVRQGDIAAGVGEEDSCVPCLVWLVVEMDVERVNTNGDELKIGEIVASTETLEWLLYSCGAYTVRNVH